MAQPFVENRWKELGPVEIISLRNGVFIFKFSSEESKMKALENSPWPLARKMLYLKPWTSDLDLKKDDVESVPVWIWLPHLKLHYYTVAGLSKFTGYIGSPFLYSLISQLRLKAELLMLVYVWI